MVRTLDGPLTAALAAVTKRPAISMQIEDHTLHFSTYQSPAGTDQLHDACVAADGSIIRVTLTRSGFTSNFQAQRVTDMSVAAQWTTWTTFTGGSGNMFQDGGCCVVYNTPTSEVWAFAQRGTGGNNIWQWKSSNNGATWSGPVTVLSPPGGALTKGIASAGFNDCFFLYDVLGGDQVGLSQWNAGGGTWGALSTSSVTKQNYGAGLAASYDGVSVYTILYSDSYSLFSAQYESSITTWVSGPTVAPATSTAVARVYPRLQKFDGLYHLVCTETDTGALTGAVYSYPRVRESADLVHWSDGWIAHDLTNTYGAALVYVALPPGPSIPNYYLITMASVEGQLAFATSHATQYATIGSSALSYHKTEKVGKPAQLDVVIDNSQGYFNAAVNLTGAAGVGPITENAMIRLFEGYYTAGGVSDTIETGRYRIQGAAFERGPEENQIKLQAFDNSRRLDLVVRWQNSWTNQSLSWMITEICARAGLFSPVLPATSQMSQLIPTFVLQAGQTYRKALDELCAMYGLAYFMDQNEVMQFRELSSSDASVWSYQPEWELLSFGFASPRANHIIVSAKPPGGTVNALTTAEAYDDTNLHLTGQERLQHVSDMKLTSTGQAAIKAALLLAEEQRSQVAHSVVVPHNPALQLLDCVTLTDYNAPTGSGTSSVCRIIETQVVFLPQRAEYQLTLHLEGR